MGGLLIIIALVVVVFLVLRWPLQGGVIAPLATLAFVGLLGAADDYLNARTGEGIRARQKLLWQTSWSPWSSPTRSRTPTRSPASGSRSSATWSIDPIVYIVFAAFAIVASSNGVNITDGLDGLVGRDARVRVRLRS